MLGRAVFLRFGTRHLDKGGTREVAAQPRLVLAAKRADAWVLNETRDDITPGRDFIATQSERP